MKPIRFWPSVCFSWIAIVVLLCAASFQNIVHLAFLDPDDAMRLLEVRDWLAGQSWWDVGQHRLGGGQFAMHWSRLVDLPLAAVMMPLDPWLPAPIVDRIAMTVVPMITLFVVIALVALISRRLLDETHARLSLLLVPLSLPLLYQLQPLRIDHHGWQIAMSLAAAWAVIRGSGKRSGIAAGLALATLVNISLEGLPFAAGLLTIIALLWIFNDRRWPQLCCLFWSFAIGTCALHALTRGPFFLAPACDAVSPGWMIMLCTASVGVTFAGLKPRLSVPTKIVAMIAAAAASAIALRISAPDCLSGPFAHLDPLVRGFWYDNVAEGLPIWKQLPVNVILTIGMPVIGVIGTVLAARAYGRGSREEWAIALGLLCWALALALMVQRAGATANAFAIPGTSYVLFRLLRRARAVHSFVPRIAATVASMLFATPGLVAVAVLGLPAKASVVQVGSTGSSHRPLCASGHEAQALARLPPATIFAPLDITPEILATSQHRAIASGYHRNQAAIRLVIATFIGSPATARRNVGETHASYIAGCPGLNETELYKQWAPGGFWARLERGDRFDWLEPVSIPGSPVLVWRVRNKAEQLGINGNAAAG